jgi:hypothetical protein
MQPQPGGFAEYPVRPNDSVEDISGIAARD